VKWRRELRIALKRLEGMPRAQAEASVPNVTLQVVDVSFRAPEERAYFMNLPSTFVLPPEEVDRLRDVTGRLMRESAEYNAVLDNFSTTAPE
jgi:NTE family protein